jgi:CheY-like chemotaxis protein
VEDNLANFELVELILAGRSHLRLLRAQDGTQGIEMARNHLPDVILMDIYLPGISGIEALKALRRDPATRHIPVMAISANAMPFDVAQGLAAGFFR